MADAGGGKEQLHTPGVPAAALPIEVERQMQLMRANLEAQLKVFMESMIPQTAHAENTAPAGAGMAAGTPAGGAPPASNGGANVQQQAANGATDTTALDALNAAGVGSGSDVGNDGTADGVNGISGLHCMVLFLCVLVSFRDDLIGLCCCLIVCAAAACVCDGQRAGRRCCCRCRQGATALNTQKK
jgi:hypothetical protein